MMKPETKKPGPGWQSQNQAEDSWSEPTPESEPQIVFAGKPESVRLHDNAVAIMATPEALLRLVALLVLGVFALSMFLRGFRA